MSDLILPDGQKKQPQPQIPKTVAKGKPKDKGIVIKQGMPVASMDSLGRPQLLIFGLGDNDEIYVWDAQARIWREK